MTAPDIAQTSIAPISTLKIMVLSDAAPSRNGVGAYYQDLIEQLEKKVREVRLISPVIDENGKWSGGLVLPLPGDKTQKFCLPNIWKLNRILKEMQPDIVIVATPGVYGLSGAYLASRKNIPFLTGFHTSFEQLTELYWPNSIRGKIVEKYFFYSNNYLFKRTEAVLGNSGPILEQANKMGAPATKLIGTPISSEFINRPVKPYSGQFSRMLFAGRLAKEKNIESILEAADALPELQFSIAGDGPLRPLVEKASANCPNINFLGWLTRENLRQSVDDHDALLLPSYFETFGTIALETMARKRPVIVSSGCGICDWDELSANLYIMRDNDNLAETLRNIMHLDSEQRLEKVEAAYASALALNDRVVDSWCRILLDTLSDYHAAKAS